MAAARAGRTGATPARGRGCDVGAAVLSAEPGCARVVSPYAGRCRQRLSGLHLHALHRLGPDPPHPDAVLRSRRERVARSLEGTCMPCAHHASAFLLAPTIERAFE